LSLENIKKLLLPIRNKINSLINRVKINSVNDDGNVQKVKVGVLKNEVLNARRALISGIASYPFKDDQGIIIFPNGNRENGYVIADIPVNRLKGLSEGNVAIYDLSDPDGNNHKFIEGNQEINTENFEINLAKIKIENDSNELISVLIELIDEIIGARTNTGIGPQALNGLTETFPAIKAKLESFKL